MLPSIDVKPSLQPPKRTLKIAFIPSTKADALCCARGAAAWPGSFAAVVSYRLNIESSNDANIPGRSSNAVGVQVTDPKHGMLLELATEVLLELVQPGSVIGLQLELDELDATEVTLDDELPHVGSIIGLQLELDTAIDVLLDDPPQVGSTIGLQLELEELLEKITEDE